VPFLLLGALTLLAALAAAGAFSRARVATVKVFLRWLLGLGGLLLAAMLLLTGRLPAGLLVLGLLGPLLLGWDRRGRPAPPKGRPPPPPPPPPRGAAMSRQEALAVLGLPPNADRQAIQETYLRLMQAAHPDRGGSDWLAARLNQARDVLLG
jgi:hypothetical protein